MFDDIMVRAKSVTAAADLDGMDEMGLAQDDVPHCLPASLSCQLPSHGPTLAKRLQDSRATRDGTVRVRPG